MEWLSDKSTILLNKPQYMENLTCEDKPPIVFPWH